MKKIILACVTTILSLSFIHAQKNAEAVIMAENLGEEEEAPLELRPILLGVTAGVNMTTYSGDRDPKMGLGGQIGINCDIPVSENFSIMPELIFAYKTVDVNQVKENEYLEVVAMKSTDKLLYMNVPVNVKWSTHVGNGRPFIAAGPMLNVGLYGENKADDGSKLLLFQSDSNGELAYRERPIYNILGFSVNLKAGYDFDFGLSITAACELGLTNMYKLNDERKLYFEEELGMKTSQKSMSFSLSLGYNF